jgi:hypothetical protein
MASLPRALPKSNYHQSAIAVPAESSSLPPPPPPPPPPLPLPLPLTDAVQAAVDIGEDGDFTHPDHDIPPQSYEGIDTLVIVCCHAIFHPDASSSSFPLKSPLDERNWHLAPFQKSNPSTGKPGEHETFIAHVLAGLTVASLAGNTLLVLSGGATKKQLTSKSESQSYLDAALAHELAEGHQDSGRAQKLLSKGRLLLEEHATDSFQNLLFSILLFRQTTGTYPKQVRIITHAFKAKRFLDLHAPAIKWPSNCVQVQGINPVMSTVELEETVEGEEKYGYAPWVQDALGTGEVLSLKRQQRGWDEGEEKELGEGLEDSIRELLAGNVSEGLPWSTAQPSTKQTTTSK